MGNGRDEAKKGTKMNLHIAMKGTLQQHGISSPQQASILAQDWNKWERAGLNMMKACPLLNDSLFLRARFLENRDLFVFNACRLNEC